MRFKQVIGAFLAILFPLIATAQLMDVDQRSQVEQLADNPGSNSGIDGSLVPGRYVDDRGAPYRIDRGGRIAGGRTPYRIRSDDGRFYVIVASGDAIGNFLLGPGNSVLAALGKGPLYGISSADMREPFCLGSLVSAVAVDGRTVKVWGHVGVNDTVSRSCAFSNKSSILLVPTQNMTLHLQSADESRSASVNSPGELVAGTYTSGVNGTGSQRYQVVLVRQKNGRNFWKFSGGQPGNPPIGATLIDGPIQGHPLFPPGFKLKLIDGLAYGVLDRGWGTEPFCTGSLVALLPIGKTLEIVSFAVVTDKVSRSCLFTAGAPMAQDAPTATTGNLLLSP